MINRKRLEAGLPLGGFGVPSYIFPSIGSTNDEAKNLAEDGSPHGTLVLADEQTSGKGREGRKWYSEPESGLALSLILRPESFSEGSSALTALGALAVVEGLAQCGLEARIKWPNDVIVSGGKIAGILVETSWRGESMDYAIVGIGVNVKPGSIPKIDLDFPATCVESEVGRRVNREDLFLDILRSFGAWYPRLGSSEVIRAWGERLAYLDQEVSLRGKHSTVIGRVAGLAADGKLMLKIGSGETLLMGEGDLRLRPIDSDKV
jgi:BirA family biotin operon repressor/biotin-[acetyl-CoA-carboxylase] ligase